MRSSVCVFDPTQEDKLSKVRGVGRYLQILKENFPSWNFTGKLPPTPYSLLPTFINPFFNLLQPPLVMKRVAQKQIAVIHDLIPFKYPSHFPIGIRGKINVFLNKLALRNYDVIITDSETSKKDVIQFLGLPENKIRVVYPCLPKIFVNKSRQNRIERIEKETTPFCLYVGDATWNKNLVNLAKAIKIINVTCVFVGKVFENSSFFHPWQKDLRDFLQETKNDKRFIFAGFVSDKELIKFYQQTKLNVLPSRDEGFGFSFLEAASQKCLSVLADIPILRKISNNQALFANPNDPHEIANAVGEAYYNNDVRITLGEKAYKQSQQFSAAKFKTQFLKAIQ